jgi:hypothetical protein
LSYFRLCEREHTFEWPLPAPLKRVTLGPDGTLAVRIAVAK